MPALLRPALTAFGVACLLSAASLASSGAAFAQAKRAATVEVYQANHGWCVKGGQVYNEAEAERAWTNLSNLYKTQLA